MADRSKEVSFLRAALPIAAIVEAIATQGKSPGTTALAQQQILQTAEERQRELEKQMKTDTEKARIQALTDKLTGLKITDLGDKSKARAGKASRQEALRKRLSNPNLTRAQKEQILLEEFPQEAAKGITEVSKKRSLLEEGFINKPQTPAEKLTDFKTKEKIKADLKATADAGKKALADEKEESKIKETQRKEEVKQTQIDEKERRKLRIGLSKELTKTKTSTAIETMNNITQFIDLDSDADIPGFGQTGGLPELSLSQAGKDTRSAVQALINITLKDRSGAAVTTQEFERFKKEIGSGFFRTDKQLRLGIKRAIKALRSTIRTIEAPFRIELGDEDFQQLREFGLRTSDDLIYGSPSETPSADDIINQFR